MGKMIWFAAFIFFVIVFACQNKTGMNKEYSTSVSGTLTYKTRGVVASIKAGFFDTTSDANGNYSLNVIHDGTFVFNISSPLVNYSENISTTDEAITRNISK
jgi:hypothetical protein